jgi:L-histidine Nalpha-methyltransferase
MLPSILPATANLRTPRFINPPHHEAVDSASEILSGLMQAQAMIAPKYFYDALGSRLFDAITALPEYYPTRTEETIMRVHLQDIASALGTKRSLVDLGAGNCEKAGKLFSALLPSRYIAVDISTDHLQQALMSLQRLHPDVEMIGVGLDFSHELKLPAQLGEQPRNLFYPGSSIGNFTPEAALEFLRQAQRESQGGSLLIGVDLVKPKAVLEAAYDDALGVTAAFNLNVLNAINKAAGTHFHLQDWKHVALFNERLSRIEMHLQARIDVTVKWLNGSRTFKSGERIHTENSYKYQPRDFEAMLVSAGFSDVKIWTDEQQWFGVFYAQA